jgi:hypothetical protein
MARRGLNQVIVFMSVLIGIRCGQLARNFWRDVRAGNNGLSRPLFVFFVSLVSLAGRTVLLGQRAGADQSLGVVIWQVANRLVMIIALEWLYEELRRSEVEAA